MLALAGTSAFALNLVLGARLRPVEALFGGLDRMYQATALNGQVAFVLLLGHVVLILASRATISTATALDLLAAGAGWTVLAGVLAFAGMTVAIVLTLFVRLGHELFVYVQRSFGIVFLGATYHVFTTHGRARRLACAEPLHGVARDPRNRRVRLPLGAREPARPPPEVPGRHGEPARRVRHRDRDGAARQAARVRAGPVPVRQLPRAASASSSRRSCATSSIRSRSRPRPTSGRLRITVKAVGDYTRALRALEPGAEAVVEGPYGSFSSSARRRPADLDRGRDRRHAVPEHGAEPERRRAGRDRLLLLRRARAGGALPRRAPVDRAASATTSGSSSSRATRTASSRPSGSPPSTQTSPRRTCSSAARRR